MSQFRIGVDLGGTKIEVAGLGPDGTMLVRRRMPSPAGAGEARYRAVVTAIAELVRGGRAGARGRGDGRDGHSRRDQRRPPAW